MYTRILPLLTTIAISTSENSRKLIVPGPIVGIEETAFAVAVLSCSTRTTGILLCAQFCSGSLISPNAVLTAGHCVHSASSKFNETEPPVALENMYVMVGTADPRTNTTVGEQLMKVKSVTNLGYALNVRYATDGDMGVMELEECVDLIPSQVEVIPVATLDTQPVPSQDTCVLIDVFGFGRSTNLPASVSTNDGLLRRMSDILHPFEVCQAAFVYGSATLQGFSASVLDQPGNEDMKAFYESYVTDEYQLCHGGNSMHASCLGDSGSGVLSSSTLVGVTSFGLGGFCGFGPDFITRVAAHADWIRIQLESFPVCPDWTLEQSFASWPVPVLDSISASRCASWQCGSGECIDVSLVCDGTVDCPDNSDETSALCPVKAASKSARNGLTRTQENANAELEDLIDQWENKHGRRLDSEAVIVVGSLTSVKRPTPPPMILGRRLEDESTESSGTEDPLDDPSDAPGGEEEGENDEVEDAETEDSQDDETEDTEDDETEDTEDSEDSEDSQEEDCTPLGLSLSESISFEKSSGANEAEADPHALLSACNEYISCMSKNAWGGTDIDPELFADCQAFRSFVITRNQAIQFVADFDTLFNNQCFSSDPIPQQLPTDFVTLSSDLVTTTADPGVVASTNTFRTTGTTVKSAFLVHASLIVLLFLAI